jgi:uncharacterized membrane protein
MRDVHNPSMGTPISYEEFHTIVLFEIEFVVTIDFLLT